MLLATIGEFCHVNKAGIYVERIAHLHLVLRLTVLNWKSPREIEPLKEFCLENEGGVGMCVCCVVVVVVVVVLVRVGWGGGWGGVGGGGVGGGWGGGGGGGWGGGGGGAKPVIK